METLDEYTQSFKRMNFTFFVNGKKVVLHRMENEGLKEVCTHEMEAIFWCNDVDWGAHFFFLAEPIKGQWTPPQDDDLRNILSDHDKDFIDIPPGYVTRFGKYQA